jgi:hypothetical protein
MSFICKNIHNYRLNTKLTNHEARANGLLAFDKSTIINGLWLMDISDNYIV